MRREVLWNVSSESNPEKHNYIFVLVNNDQRERSRILQRIHERLAPTNEEMQITKGKGYQALSLSSPVPPSRVDWVEVYRGSIRKDRDLYERRDPDGLSNYIDLLMEKQSMKR